MLGTENVDWKQFTVSVVIGYGISWGYFILSLPLFIKLFGKLTGTALNYGISWILWIFISALLKMYA